MPVRELRQGETVVPLQRSGGRVRPLRSDERVLPLNPDPQARQHGPRDRPTVEQGLFSGQVDPRGFVPSLSETERLEALGRDVTGAPYGIRELGGYAVDEEGRRRGLQAALEDHFGEPVNVQTGPTGRLEFRHPETGRWTIYNPPGLDVGDVVSLEGEAFPVGGSIGGAVAGGGFGAVGGPAGGTVGTIAGEAVGAALGEFARLRRGQSLGMVDAGVSDLELATRALTTGAWAGAGAGVGAAVAKLFLKLLGTRGIALDVDPELLARRVNERLSHHREVGTRPTTGQTMRGTEAGDELLTAERELKSGTGAVSRQLRQRQRENLGAATRFFDEAGGPRFADDELFAADALSPERYAERVVRDEGQEQLGLELERLAGDRLSRERGDLDRLGELYDDAARRRAEAAAGSARAPSETGPVVRSALARAEREWLDELGSRYDELGRAARGLTVKPSDPLQLSKEYRKLLDSDVYQSLSEVDQQLVRDGLKLQKTTRTDLVDQYGRKLPPRSGTRELGYDQVHRALSALRRLERAADRGTVPPPERRMITRLKKAWHSTLRRLLEQRPELWQRRLQLDAEYAGMRQQFNDTVINRVLQKSPGGTGWRLEDERVIDVLLRPNNASAVRELDVALRRSDNEDALYALRRAVEDKWQREVVDPETGHVRPRSHERFVRRHGEALRRFLPDAARRRLDDAAQVKRWLDERNRTLRRLERGLQQSLEGRVVDAEDPAQVFELTWKSTRPALARRTRELTAAGGDVAQSLADAYRAQVKRHLFLNATDVTDEGHVLSASKLDQYLADYGPQLREWFDADYVERLATLREALRDVRAGVERPVRDRGPVAAIYDLTRAYVGLFTRPGRVVTAFRKLKGRRARDRAARLLLDPETLRDVVELRRTVRPLHRGATVAGGVLGADPPALDAMSTALWDEVLRDAWNPSGRER